METTKIIDHMTEVIFCSNNGDKFRVKLELNHKLSITKVSDNEDQLMIFPKVGNQILIQ